MVSRHQRIIVLEATDKNENIGYLNHTSRAVVEIKVEREEREKANKPPTSQTKSKKKKNSLRVRPHRLFDLRIMSEQYPKEKRSLACPSPDPNYKSPPR
jgi:hypothetical protein